MFQIADKIRYAHPLNGGLTDRIIAQKYLETKKAYRVKSVIGQGDHQMVQLMGLKRVWFRSLLFKLVKAGTPEKVAEIEAKQRKPVVMQKCSPFIQQWMEANGITQIA